MATAPDDVAWFENIGIADVPIVGGKNASLGELYRALGAAGVRVPNGFALTASAYNDALREAGCLGELHALLDGLDITDVALLATRAAAARALVHQATGGAALAAQIRAAYKKLEQQYGANVAVAVRSSATAEDLPTASFAGQHESFLNITGPDELVEACRRCFASIFTDRAIVYRVNNGFDHFKVALSVGVMKMVRSDRASSGVIFTLDTESGFTGVVLITGSYGLGENVVQGKVDPDEFFVHKPSFRDGHRAVLRRRLGSKQLTMGLAAGDVGATTVDQPTPADQQARFCLEDAEVLTLAGQALAIEAHYSAKAGHDQPMDIEWAKDAVDGQLYIVQARPETVASRKIAGHIESFHLTGSGELLTTGRAVGERIATGIARVIDNDAELARFRPGEILVAVSTSPDWEPVRKTAAAIITDHGGRTCHAAIVARELGVPAVVGCGDATTVLRTGMQLTVSCANGETGQVFAGEVAFTVTRADISRLVLPKTAIMTNLGNPDLAFSAAMLPSAGVGLARMEFIINEHIGIHPMALAHPERCTKADQAEIARRTQGFASPRDYFIARLAEGVGTIAAAFHPRPVIVRLSDFKTNEYAALLGGGSFEPKEANPMLGFRGAARYAHPAYADGFALECAALRAVRDTMGLRNLVVMVPFCRRVAEARLVLDAMAQNGLARGQDGLAVYMMTEIPNNVILIDEFSKLFDGFSIGSNDLTQLTLGVDRDSDIVAFDFDERDPGMLEMLRLAVTGAQRNHRKIGICGEAPANYPEIAKYLVGLHIDSISVNPSSLLRTIELVQAAEAGG